ncbi:MAG: hypothetical protein F6J87_30040 [Spirulina sp. SIO3F2]|nr:hypothetical protein [Spirulina sp. SIO3F2]
MRTKKALPPSEHRKKEYTIVKVRARELGYSVAQIDSGSALGIYVARKVNHAFFKRVGDFKVKHYEGGSFPRRSIK